MGCGARLGRRLGCCLPLREQECEVACAVLVSARLRAPKRGLGIVALALLGQEHTQVAGRGRVTAPVGSRVGSFGGVQMTALLQQHSEIERAVGIACPVGAAVGALGPVEIAPLLKENAQVARRWGVTRLCGPRVGTFGARQIPTLLEQRGDRERALGRAQILRGAVRAPCHLPQSIDDLMRCPHMRSIDENTSFREGLVTHRRIVAVRERPGIAKVVNPGSRSVGESTSRPTPRGW